MNSVTMTNLIQNLILTVTGDPGIIFLFSVWSKPCLPVGLFLVDGFMEDDPPVSGEQRVSDS